MYNGDFGVTLHAHPQGHWLLAVTGELDHHTAPRLRGTLEDLPRDPDTTVIVDVSGLNYCDSSGIAALVTAYRRVVDPGGRLVLAGPDDEMMRLFGIVGLDELFTIRSNVEEAAATLSS
ncbi:STAS domain-containing protein [Streptomyces calidiresistens]|uniref:Anti-sigma factor antagonist n=1 Tax=Streptomyces calidiresistens TaxID=1485586 RepID=A0A7W3T4C0_9ACTN|nr:anti-sigma factor antagonist [Streptomyces calidiresistens]MBB0230699.1 anti-sigma factor antagonist [Streptomyces calidiresistens]